MKIVVSMWERLDRMMIPPSADALKASCRGLASVCVWRNTHVPPNIRTNPNRFALRSELRRNNPNQVEPAPNAMSEAFASDISRLTIATIVNMPTIQRKRGIVSSVLNGSSPANAIRLPIAG